MPFYTRHNSLSRAGENWNSISSKANTCALLLYFRDKKDTQLNHFFVWSSQEGDAATLARSFPSIYIEMKDLDASVKQLKNRQTQLSKRTVPRLLPEAEARELSANEAMLEAFRAFNTEAKGLLRMMADLSAREPAVGEKVQRRGHAEEFMCEDFPGCLLIAGQNTVKSAHIYLKLSPCSESKNFGELTGCLAKLCALAENYINVDFDVGFKNGYKLQRGQDATSAAVEANAYATNSRPNIKFSYQPEFPWAKGAASSSEATSSESSPSH